MMQVLWIFVTLLCGVILGVIIGYSLRETFTEGKLTFDFREEAPAPVIIKLDDIPEKRVTCLKVEYLQDRETNAKAVINLDDYREEKE